MSTNIKRRNCWPILAREQRTRIARVADQREDYLFQTMTAYRTDARHAYDATMVEVLQPVDDNDLGVLAHFLAHVR